MKKITLSILLLSTSLSVFCKTWTVNNSGFTFAPATITIMVGDTVKFVLQNVHNALEVSQASWNANDNTPLPGGFVTPFGGGLVLPAKLGVGTHYYVCDPHASMGMKGKIIVQNTSGVIESQPQPDISINPNPSTGTFQLVMEETPLAGNCKVEIYNAKGSSIYKATITNTKFNLDLSNQTKGVYYVKIYNGGAMLTRKMVIQ